MNVCGQTSHTIEEKFSRGAELELSKKWVKLSTGCQRLNGLLRGGLLTRGVTELVGQSSCGKTQLCLQLALTVQLPLKEGGLAAGAAFICTEDRFPSVRLNQLIKSCTAIQQCSNIQFGSNIFVEHVADSVDLRQCVVDKLPQLIRQHRIGLVVVDSVAAVFRADYTPKESVQRARDLRTFALQLHRIANEHNIVVVCVNQVSDIKRGESSQTVPALGLAWANLVTYRLQMKRNNDLRHIQVVYAPHLPQGVCQYKITSTGVEGC